MHATPVSPAECLVSSSLEPWEARRARAAFLTVSDKPTWDASRARCLGPLPLPLFSHAAPQAPACVSRSGGPGASAPSPARRFSRARSHAAASASTLWLRDDSLGCVPAAGPSARGGQTLPRPAGGQLYEQQQGRRLPPTLADPGALPLPEGGGTLGRPLRCPPRARGSTGGSGLAVRRLPLAPAPAIRCPAPASSQEQHMFSGGRRGGSSF